jgi:polar amino acid transport system substrate-binding protein
MRSFLRLLQLGLPALMLSLPVAVSAFEAPSCARPLSLALHDHGLLYSAQTGEGIDKDIADEMIRRSGCKLRVSVMPRARIWQLIEAGTLDFSLSGISNPVRDGYAAFAWYFSNKYHLLVRKDAGVRRLADFEAAPGFVLGAIRGFRYGASANGLVDRLDAARRVSYATGLDPLYETLLGNRVQAMIIEPFDFPALQGGLLRELTTIVDFDDPAIPHGLIMSKKSLPAAQRLAWAALIDDMRADGSVQRIFERYFSPEQARSMTQF